jgi:hypothetical protein
VRGAPVLLDRQRYEARAFNEAQIYARAILKNLKIKDQNVEKCVIKDNGGNVFEIITRPPEVSKDRKRHLGVGVSAVEIAKSVQIQERQRHRPKISNGKAVVKKSREPWIQDLIDGTDRPNSSPSGYAKVFSSACASAISGISGVGEKPSTAAARTS